MGLITVLSDLELAQIRICMLRLDSSKLNRLPQDFRYNLSDVQTLQQQRRRGLAGVGYQEAGAASSAWYRALP